jgi:hypothetical protein
VPAVLLDLVSTPAQNAQFILLGPMLETFTIDTFDGRVGEFFRAQFDPQAPAVVELIEVTRHGEAAEGQRAPFSLLFRGEPEPVHPQQIYAIEHDELGSFELFLVPVGPDEHGQRYEAVFS